MAPKRAGRPSTGAAMKRPKTGGIQSEVKIVAHALASADLDKVVVKTLSTVVPYALSQYAEERHAYENSVLNMAEETLQAIKGTNQKAVAVIKAKLSGRDAEKIKREAAVLDGAKAIAAAKTDAAKREYYSYEAGTILVKAEKLAKEATKAQKAGNEVYNALAAKRELLDGIKAKVAVMKAGSCPKKDVVALEKDMSPYKFDPTLISHMHLCLTKAPADLTDFESKMMAELESELAARSTELDGKIAAEEPGKKVRDAAADAAASALTAAKDKDADATAALSAATAAVKKAQSDLKTTEAKFAGFDHEMKDVEKGLAAAEATLSDFVEGPLSSFATLKVRSAPPPEPEEPDVPEPAVPEPAVPEPVAQEAAAPPAQAQA